MNDNNFNLNNFNIELDLYKKYYKMLFIWMNLATENDYDIIENMSYQIPRKYKNQMK